MRRPIWTMTCGMALLALFLVWGCGDAPDDAPARSTAGYDKDGYLIGSAERPADPPNLIVILIDTLRGDAVALPGDKFETRMPYVSSIAKEGVSFSNATAPAPWTLPSLTSFLTGVMPSEHGVNIAQSRPALNGRFTTVAEALRNGWGYETLGFAAGPWFDHRNSVWQGFRAQSGGFVMQAAAPLLNEWIKELDPNRPFFLMLHTFEAHDPYGEKNHPHPKPLHQDPPKDYDAALVTDVADMSFDFLTNRHRRIALERVYGRDYVRDVMKYLYSGYRANPDPEMAAKLATLYWEGVRWVDGLVEKTVTLLRGWNLLDDTLLIITSDHGEGFGEHGMLEHGRSLYDELLRVPLVMIDFRKDPSKQVFRGGRVFRGPTATIDVLPTYFAYAGLRQLDDIQGRPFLKRILADDRTGGDPVYSEELLNYQNTMQRNIDSVLGSARSDRWKYILNWDRLAGTITEELYDLRKDPEEQDNLTLHRPLAEIEIDPKFCASVEAVRDRLWGAAKGTSPEVNNPYLATEGSVDPTTRPAPCASALK